MDIYTIGHSNHTWEKFSTLLKQHGIGALVDVRSKPVSRWAAFANRRSLPGLLEEEGIQHVYMGELLGGKPSDPSCYDEKGILDYNKIRSTPYFRAGIVELLELARGARVVLMCAEEDPTKCHRTLLIAPALEERGVNALHIRKDGSVQSPIVAAKERG